MVLMLLKEKLIAYSSILAKPTTDRENKRHPEAPNAY